VKASSSRVSTAISTKAQAQLGGGVVGGLAVVDQFDAAEEIRRHLVAVGGDVAHVADVEPQAQGGGQGKGGEEDQREVGGSHGRAGAVRECRDSGNGIGKLWHRIKTRSSGWTWK
jgi:hypothetical protein